MPCGWCGAWRGVRLVERGGLLMPSPRPGVPLYLCPRCWGTYRETGERSGMGRHAPARGPVTGRVITPETLRAGRP
jgi:hypothetical protein